jgi:hypothetical protein
LNVPHQKLFYDVKVLNSMDLPAEWSGNEKLSLTDRKMDYFCRGELAERSIAAVLKTVVLKGTWGSNP